MPSLLGTELASSRIDEHTLSQYVSCEPYAGKFFRGLGF